MAGPLAQAQPRTRGLRRAERPNVETRRGGKRFAIALDPEGKLDWSSPEIDGDPLIVALARDVPDAYLERLRERRGGGVNGSEA